ncbi:alkane 1-monooxygenase [Roseovarius faecimaris]|uniref:Alkane 1-monooxygenase n=1 Tax=Roseovarius faecimaris TaxID=2494550 RepID=A0A6I6IR28_9RHOB|nr:alkane 1-monooxygenase [Roseovarius faecimaris]QGX97696.1 alkane 1-monooxygenase [Roseovarius faecimaris]
MPLFATATLLPFALLIAAALWGGAWSGLAFGYVTLLVYLMDRLSPVAASNADPEAEFPGSDGLLRVLGGLHFLAFATSLWAMTGASGLSLPEKLLVAITCALIFGQISHPVAHELIHRPARDMRLLGRLIYTSVLFGHHASAHLRVHHVHVGSNADPNSARWGEGFYRFARRAWRGSFRAGLAAENRLRAGRGGALRHPYLLYCGGAVAILVGAAWLGGLPALVALLFIGFYTQVQILLSDYVQHYGLRRATQADGRLEPVGPQHSWNAPHWASAAMTLNAPRHSDHHVTPARPYPALQLRPEDMPYLPYSLPAMAALALFPPLWRRVMDPHCARWAARGASPAAEW